MTKVRGKCSAAILNGLIYVIGGCCTNNSTSVQSYDPKTNVWTERMSLDVDCQDRPFVASNGFLYAFPYKRQVRQYDPEENV